MAGVGIGVLIFLFQAAATDVIGLSERIYSCVRANPVLFPLLLAGALILGEECKVVLTVVGMAAFLGASSRIPLTGIAFAVEALCGLSNLIPVALGVALAYLVIEAVGMNGFNETVIESKVEVERHGKTR